MLSTQAHDDITLHYQPLAECLGKVVGFEALMRWHHQQRGAISPEAFIPIFERSGQIVPLSRWGLREVCLEAATWVRPLGVSFNLSAVLFQEEDLQGQVASILAETDLGAWRLELELTQDALVVSPDRTLTTLTALSAMGISITLDDFGDATSPEWLKRCPFSKIKIDRKFVLNMETSVAAKSAIHMIIEFGHAHHLTVVAKGVETQGQLAFLTDEGCDLVQGFLIGRPASIETYADLTGNLPSQWGSRGADPLDREVPADTTADPAMIPASAALVAITPKGDGSWR